MFLNSILLKSIVVIVMNNYVQLAMPMLFSISLIYRYIICLFLIFESSVYQE